MEDIRLRLQLIQKCIEDALWDNGPEEAMTVWAKAEVELLDIPLDSPEAIRRERDRILSYCLLRQKFDDPVANLKKMLRSLDYARSSGNRVQIMRAYGSLSSASRECGDSAHAWIYLEKQMETMEAITGEEALSYDVRQGYGWYHIFRARLYSDGNDHPLALRELEKAKDVFECIGNYAGLRRVWAIRRDYYTSQGFREHEAHAVEEYERFDGLTRKHRR